MSAVGVSPSLTLEQEAIDRRIAARARRVSRGEAIHGAIVWLWAQLVRLPVDRRDYWLHEYRRALDRVIRA